MTAETALIGIDWGTTSFRAHRIDQAGGIAEEKSVPAGILRVGGDFEGTFAREIGPWLAAAPGVPVIASGMITSRQGWVEVPYCACPAGSTEIAAALRPHVTVDGPTIHFVPGLSFVGADGVPDVIRGEETQIVGEIGDDADRRLLVLPGTHSKWALIEGGRIVSFATFMTGELYGVLSEHSILGRLMAGHAEDAGAYRRGLAYARGGRGGLLRRLFSARTLGLFDQVPASGIASYLSGLLIGTEIAEALDCLEAPPADQEITIVGGSDLTARYLLAIQDAGLRARRAAPHVTARGQLQIARAAGLFS